MIIFLYGPDGFRLQKKSKEIENHYRNIHKGGLNLKIINLKEQKLDNLFEELQINSIFKEKKLIVIKNIFLNENVKKHFLENGKEFAASDDIFLVCENGVPSEKDKLFTFLKKNAKTQEFNLVGGVILKNWVKKEIESHKIKITEGALNLLLGYVGNNLWQMDNEIKKLVNYKKSGEINEKDVHQLVKPNIETDIFQTINQIAIKNKKGAIYLLRKHLEKEDSPLYLFSMINFQFRNLLIIKSLETNQRLYSNNDRFFQKELEMHPFVVRKTITQATKFSIGELKKIYHKIFEADLNIKTGKISPEAALDLFITAI